jgi:hypothetical protein
MMCRMVKFKMRELYSNMESEVRELLIRVDNKEVWGTMESVVKFKMRELN